jgi:hypothetical protein
MKHRYVVTVQGGVTRRGKWVDDLDAVYAEAERNQLCKMIANNALWSPSVVQVQFEMDADQ